MREPQRLIGRDEELSLLTRTLDSASTSAAVLAGHAGVGKTRLARELAQHARSTGRQVEWLVATPATQEITLGALAPVLGTPPPPVSASELLPWAGQQLTQHDDLVVCVDDAHLLDSTSAALLLQLASRRDVFVVATVRTGSPCPEPITSLWKDGWAERVEVVPLSRAETGALARELLGADLDDGSLTRLYELSTGIPMFLREILIAGEAEGSIIATTDGTKEWQGPLQPTTRLIELVTARLGQLPPDHRAAMDLVALGEPLDLEIAEQITERDVLAVLEERELLSLVEPPAAERELELRVAHPLYSEVLRRRLPRARSRALHRQLAHAATNVRRVTAGRGRSDSDLLRIARWRLAAGDLDDPELLIAGAELALRTFDTDLTEELGRAAHAAGAGPRADLVVADSHFYANRWTEAAEALDALPDADLDDRSLAHAAIRRSSLLIWSTGDPEAAHDALADMAGKITDDALRFEVNAERIWTLVVSNRIAEAVALARDYIDTGAANPPAAMRALPPAVVALTISGATGDALDVADQAQAIVGSVEDVVPTVQGDLLAGACFALWLDGRLPDTLALLDSMADDVVTDWSDSARGLVAFIRGKALLEQGHAAHAADVVRVAIDALIANDIGLFLPWAYNVLARALTLTGDIDGAGGALADGEAHRRSKVELSEPDRLIARAAIAEATTPGAGVSMSARNAAGFGSWGALPYALGALADKARFGGAVVADADLADELASGCQGRLAPCLARLVRGLATRNAELLTSTATECESMLLDLVAAEASLVAAARFDDAAQPGSALAARQRAADCLSRCGPVRTPIVDVFGGDAPLATLTPREREVARLVATGLTNREVAEMLHVADRTVDNHVQHVFTKLGINSRDALRSLV